MNLLIGLSSYFLVSLVLAFFELTFNIQLYSTMLLYFVPFFAMVFGVLGGLGYYFSSKILNIKTKEQDKIKLICMAVACYILIQIIEYFNIKIDGNYIWKEYNFFEYFNIITQNLNFGFYSGIRHFFDTGTLGIWGYVFVVIQIAGFSIGGAVAFELLKFIPYCDNCQLYMKNDIKVIQYFSDKMNTVKKLLELNIKKDEKEIDKEIVRIDQEHSSNNHFRIVYEKHVCTKCNNIKYIFNAEEEKSGQWASLKD